MQHQSTYHHRRMMDKHNLFQLSFYGDVGRMCRVVDEACRDENACGDASLGEQGEDDGDGSRRGAGGGSGVTPSSSSGLVTHRAAKFVNRKGGAQWRKMHNSTFAYLLHQERSGGSSDSDSDSADSRGPAPWRLRLVQGLPQVTYDEYRASPLHFACAARNREMIILLLQSGCEDSLANFYQHSSLLCSHMLDGDADLSEVFHFWQGGRRLWAPRHHPSFPATFKTLVRILATALHVRGHATEGRKLCDDLLLSVIGWMPTDVTTLARWWPKHK